MKILVACEESQEITKRLREKGHEAYSCDIQETSGPMPEYHLQCDVKQLLKLKWDCIIAFPPCTDLASSGARWFKEKQKDGRQAASIEFFKLFTELDCPMIMIENPVGIMSSHYRKPDQIIQPYMFGHTETKATCLWLKGLPLLQETNNVKQEMDKLPNKVKHRIHYASGKNRAKIRSKTFSGVAQAIVEQWF